MLQRLQGTHRESRQIARCSSLPSNIESQHQRINLTRPRNIIQIFNARACQQRARRYVSVCLQGARRRLPNASLAANMRKWSRAELGSAAPINKATPHETTNAARMVGSHTQTNNARRTNASLTLRFDWTHKHHRARHALHSEQTRVAPRLSRKTGKKSNACA